MKTFNPFLSPSQIRSYPNLYTFGIEVEFYSNDEYFKHVKNSSADCSVLGIDGAGKPTGEYRSPVFKSNSPRIATNGCIKFTNQIINYVKSNFPCTFSPLKTKILSVKQMINPRWCNNCNMYHADNGDFPAGPIVEKDGNQYIQSEKKIPLGIHFSIGGKFFSETSYFLDIYNRAEEVQKKLIDVVENKDLYLAREKIYPGTFDRSNHAKAKDYDSYLFTGIKSAPQALRLLELRFLPSCDFPSVVPYLTYIVLGGSIPSNTITNFNNCEEDD